MKKIVITGGHLTPALALIDEINKEKEKWQIYYFGRKYALEGLKEKSFEFRSVSELKEINFIPITTGRLQRRFTSKTIVSLLKVPFGFLQTLFYLIRIKPNLVVSFGGYLSVPAVISASMLGIPSLTHSQTSALGLSDKINSLFAKKIAVSFPSVLNKLPQEKTTLTGNPLRKEIFQKKAPAESELFTKLKNEKKPLLYITGGKTGSKTINAVVKQALPDLTKHFFVLHQIGLDKTVEPIMKKNYIATRFIQREDIGWVLSKAELVVSRSGINYVLEFAFLGKKAILVPIPWSSGDEQKKNAQFLVELGLAKIIPQSKLAPKHLVKEVLRLDKKPVNLNYPLWWSEVNPQKAAKKIWLLAKDISKDHEI